MPIPKTNAYIDRVSTQHRVYNILKKWIIDGTLMPGEFISDSEIAKHFSVSRTPVREAILLLSQQDFVQIMPSKGTKITETSQESAHSIYEAISCLSAEIAILAVKKHKPEDIKHLIELNKSFFDAIVSGKYSKIIEIDSAFHNYILKIANNPFISNSWNQILPHATRYEMIYFNSGNNKELSVSEHTNIINAIESGNEKEAASYSRKNWIDFFNKRLKPQLENISPKIKRI